MKSVWVLIALLVSAAAEAQTPAFDPREWKGAQAGPPTEMLTLGSVHLSQLPVPIGAAMMAELLDKLAAYRPEVITVENVSGEECDGLKRYAAAYPDSFASWCNDPVVAQQAIGMDLPAAAAEIHKMLLAWPAAPDPGARRHLAALFLAAGETPSAVVQWRRLPASERHAGDGLTEATLPLVTRADAKPNETYDIGVALAVRLSLDRIHLVDDHTSDGALPDEGKAYEAAVEAAWKIAPSQAVVRESEMARAVKTPADVLALYRFVNQPGTLRDTIKADFGATLGQKTDQLYGRRYVAAWEVRNLRMVANIRATIAAHPGARVLNIVGASHKLYYDAYLDMMHDVKLVDAEAVLR